MSAKLNADGIYGLRAVGVPSSGALNLNTANIRLAFGIVLPADKTLSKVKVYCSGVTGTLGTNDLVASLYAVANGTVGTTTGPSGTALDSRNVVTAVPTGAAWVEWTGFTYAMTTDVLYMLVLNNANATPASNFAAFRWCTNFNPAMIGDGPRGWFKRHSTDGGSTYGTNVGGAVGIRLEFSDGSFLGLPLSNGAVVGSSLRTYSTRECGAAFTARQYERTRFNSIGTYIAVTGTPTGNPRFRIYQAGTLIATSGEVLHRANGQMIVASFASTIELVPGVQYYAVLGESSNADSSSNAYSIYSYDVENDANSRALMPYGDWQLAYYDGSSWALTNTSAPVMWLLGDGDQPDGSIASGGFF